jgi:sec-independent protein translocase protein TatA
MRLPQGAEWLIILLLILVLFGAKRLPDAARGLGRSMRILKAETKGLRDEDDKSQDDQGQPQPAAPPQVTAAGDRPIVIDGPQASDATAPPAQPAPTQSTNPST